jgi:hypothetical protein
MDPKQLILVDFSQDQARIKIDRDITETADTLAISVKARICWKRFYLQ